MGHVGSEDELVDDGLLVFESKKYDGYQNDMNGNI